jgi:hypothetical protein
MVHRNVFYTALYMKSPDQMCERFWTLPADRESPFRPKSGLRLQGFGTRRPRQLGHSCYRKRRNWRPQSGHRLWRIEGHVRGSNLHVVSYSVPARKHVSLAKLIIRRLPSLAAFVRWWGTAETGRADGVEQDQGCNGDPSRRSKKRRHAHASNNQQSFDSPAGFALAASIDASTSMHCDHAQSRSPCGT